MNRRDAIGALLATVCASPGAFPIPAYGQTRVRRIVSVTGNAERTVSQPLQDFRQEMKALGYQEGRDIALSIGYGEFSRERTAQLAADAIASKPDLIFAQHGAVHAFKTARALGIKIPQSVLLRADRVIE